MKDVKNEKLEQLCDEMLSGENDEIAEKVIEEAAQLIVDDCEVIIDGMINEDGSVDPAHILVDIDNRYYFGVYTSVKKFQKCNGAHAYVLPLASLLQPIYQEDTFGGIALNMKKGDPMVLISKEEIYEALQERISVHA